MRFWIPVLLMLPPILAQAQFADPRLGDNDAEGFARIKIVNEDYGFILRDAIWQKPQISVCWENSSTETDAHRALVKAAIEDTWMRYSKLNFTGWEKCANQNVQGIRILINNGHPHVKKLGRHLSGLRNGMLLNFTFDMDDFRACTENSTMYELCIRSIAVHEFGHAIGLSHEHNRTDKDASCAQPRQGGNGDLHLTPYDPDSVMNYCNPRYNNYGKLSYYDVLSVQAVYGAP